VNHDPRGLEDWNSESRSLGVLRTGTVNHDPRVLRTGTVNHDPWES
jgi:hypothetical protein